jgi:hypothetical protein
MIKRGRKSAEEIAIAANVIAGGFGKRPEPPVELTEKQIEIWKLVVSSEPQDYFNSEALRGLLADYCRHRESANMVSLVIESFKGEWLKSNEGAKRYKALLQMRDIETRAAAGLATKLRLTNQSRYTPEKAATAARNAAVGPMPWDE